MTESIVTNAFHACLIIAGMLLAYKLCEQLGRRRR